MSVSVWPALIEQLRELPDPRVERTRVHHLIDILTIAICAVICGAEGWDDFVAFGRAKQDWLKEKLELELPAGIPSADKRSGKYGGSASHQFEPPPTGDNEILWYQGQAQAGRMG